MLGSNGRLLGQKCIQFYFGFGKIVGVWIPVYCKAVLRFKFYVKTDSLLRLTCLYKITVANHVKKRISKSMAYFSYQCMTKVNK